MAIVLNTTVRTGHRIEVTAPELPEGAEVRLIVSDVSSEPILRYPSVLEVEYSALIDKQLHNALTDVEQRRLHDVRSVIAEIDRLTLAGAVRTQHLDETELELNRLRQQIEALPDS